MPVFPEPETPDEVWQVDFMFVYIDGYGFCQLLTFLDAFSRLPIHHELLAQASFGVAVAALKKAVEKNRGIPPRTIVTNNGSTFVNLKVKKPTAFQQACSGRGISHQAPVT